MNYFEEYKKQIKSQKYKKVENWCTAIGLQQVDNLMPSKYLIEISKNNIDGKLSINSVKEQIIQYYKNNPPRTIKEHNEKEADMVSINIVKLLNKNNFIFDSKELISIHKELFTNVLDAKMLVKYVTTTLLKMNQY